MNDLERQLTRDGETEDRRGVSAAMRCHVRILRTSFADDLDLVHFS